MRSNRWYTSTGKAKRVSADVEYFREWAIKNKSSLINLDIIDLTKSCKVTWHLGLADAANLMVYLVGVYSNSDRFIVNNNGLFREERYKLGKLIAEHIKYAASFDNVKVDIRKLELVKK